MIQCHETNRYNKSLVWDASPYRPQRPTAQTLGCNMYFWKIKPLAKQLSLNNMPERTGMHYLLASFLLILFSTYYALWWGVVRDWVFYSEIIVLSVINIFGCIKAFEANGADDSNSFVLRVICLSVPISVRINLYSIIIGMIFYLTSESVFTEIGFADPVRAYTIITYTVFVGLNIYFWWLVVYGLNKVTGYERAT